MKVYISGPISLGGTLDDAAIKANMKAFSDAEARLVAEGHEPLNPCIHGAGKSWSEYMRLDIAMVLRADRILLLPGWNASKGSVLELDVARAIGLDVEFADNGG
jgi:hypothetical protein